MWAKRERESSHQGGGVGINKIWTSVRSQAPYHWANRSRETGLKPARDSNPESPDALPLPIQVCATLCVLHYLRERGKYVIYKVILNSGRNQENLDLLSRLD